jgi:hypothetical protein
MFGVSTCLVFAVLLTVQPPDATGDASALPRYDDAPAPVADVEPAAPSTPIPLTPEQTRYARRVGIGLTIAGGVFLVAGVAGLTVGMSGLAGDHFGSDYDERQQRALIGAGVGGPCSAIGVGFSIVGALLRAQARSAPKLQVSVSPTWLHGGGGLAVGGRF